jgi:pimeloyl-ACP methyl ester carboxylesterase
MAKWSEGFVPANGLNIFYHRSQPDNNKPSVLLLHGFADNGLCWSPVARMLEKDYNVIMTDARGHGRTEGLIKDLGQNQLAEDAAAVIRELGLEKPFLFGHSMGGMTAITVAANYPELVRAIVLEDPPLRDLHQFTAEEEQQLHQMAKENLAFHDLPLAERIIRGKTQNPNWSDEEIQPWAESKGEYDPEILEHRKTFRESNWRETLTRVQCPALLITAETQKGAIVTPEAAQEAKQLCPQCEIIYIRGAGHCIHRDRFEETMNAVLNFLGKH